MDVTTENINVPANLQAKCHCGSRFMMDARLLIGLALFIGHEKLKPGHSGSAMEALKWIAQCNSMGSLEEVFG
jgi:hypothetical protein